MDKLQNALNEFSVDTENAEKNYQLALCYEEIKQTASAVTYFFRAAERTEDKTLAYECLVKMALCFERQGNRENTVRRVLQSAISLLPKRPEAYFLMSRALDRVRSYVDGYVYSQMALENCDFNIPPLRSYVEYPGKYGVIFEKAVCAWWWGKIEESTSLFFHLQDVYGMQLDSAHANAIQSNIDKLNLKRPNTKKTIIDCFTYYDETCREILELRYNVLKDHVDKFAVCESNKTQTGVPIERKLRQTIAELGLDASRFIIVDLDIPDEDSLEVREIDRMNCYEDKNERSYKARVRERVQKNFLNSPRVLNLFDNNTYFIVSDCDEIIDPKNIEFVMNMADQYPNNIFKLPLAHLEGKANLRVLKRSTMTPKPWDGAMFVCKKEHLRKAEVIQIRSNLENPFPILYLTQDGKRIEDFGWHFSWMGDSSRRLKKLEGFVHSNEKMSILQTGSYDSKETLERMAKNPRPGDMSVSCEVDTILVKYPENKLPPEITQNEKMRDFFLTKDDTVSNENLTVEELLESEYQHSCNNGSDIYAHVPTLRKYASECKHVTEMGVRDGQSTRALLPENVVLRSYDLFLDPLVTALFVKAKSIGKDVEYLVGDTLAIDIEETDLLFLDTEHTYQQVTGELNRHHTKVRKYIAFHDTAEPFVGEVLPAIVDFTIRNPEWKFVYHNRDCHGFTVIAKE